MSNETATLKIHESDMSVSAVCGGNRKIFMAYPNTLFTLYSSVRAHSRTTILLSTKKQDGPEDPEIKTVAELPGIVKCMIFANNQELYLLRHVQESPDLSTLPNGYFDVLEQSSGRLIRSVRMPRVVGDMYMLQDGALCAWSNSYQLISTDDGKSWTQLPKKIPGFTNGCGYKDSMFFLREGILSELKGADIRQGNLEESIIARIDPEADSLVADEDTGILYTVLKKDGRFNAHAISGNNADVFLVDDSANPGHGLVLLRYTKKNKFYVSADFRKQPFHEACYLLATDGKTYSRSRLFMDGPELSGHVNNLIFFYAKTGLESYSFFHIDLNAPVK